jgi:tetratricopeptide (TPR) repeat protein
MLAIAGVAVQAPVPAASAQPTSKKEKEKAAKAYVDAGLAAQERGDHDTAISMYAKAYELVPHPILVFNMAQAHRLAGRTAQALDYYRRYLADAAKGPKAKTAREFITALEGQLVVDEAAKARAAEEARQADEARQAEDARKAKAAADARAAEEAARGTDGGDGGPKTPDGDGRIAPIDDGDGDGGDVGGDGDGGDDGDDAGGGGGGGGKGLRIVGLTSGVLGLAAIGAGVPVALKARSIADELSTPGNTYDPARDDEGKQAGQISLIATAAGGVLLLGGVTLYFVGRSRAHGGVAITPVVDPDQVGFMVRGAY